MSDEKFNKELFESILDAKLDAKINPLVETVKRLEKVSEHQVEILQALARYDEKIRNLEEGRDKNEVAHNDLYKKIRHVEGDSKNKMWDVIKLVLAAVISAGVVRMF